MALARGVQQEGHEMEIIDASLPNSQGRRLTSALAGFWWQADHPVSQFLPCVSDLAIGRKTTTAAAPADGQPDGRGDEKKIQKCP